MAKAIQLKDSNNLALLPITDSKLVQHWNGTSYVAASTLLHSDHNDIQTLSSANEATNKAKISLSDGGSVSIEGHKPNAATSTYAYVGLSTSGNVTTIKVSYTDWRYSHFSQNVPSVSNNPANKDITGTTGVQEVITGITINTEGHVTSYTKTKIYSTDSQQPANDVTGNAAWSKASYIVVTNAASGNVVKQSTIDIANVALKSDVEDAIGSAIHLKGTVGPSGADVTALPTSNVKIGDAYLVKGVSSPPNTTILSGSSVENGDLIIATATTPSWTVIQNNVDATRIVTRIKGTGDNWISVTPTDYTSGDVTLSVTHSGPSVTGATVGPAGNKKLDHSGSTFAVPKITFDNHGHITSASTITYTMPSESNAFANIITDVDETDITENTTKGTVAADSTTDSVTLRGGNKWITTGVNTTSDIAYINHKTWKTADGNIVANASGASAAWSIDVVKGVTLSYDAAGHVTGLSVSSGKIPANPNTDEKVKEWGKSDSKTYPILFSYTNSNASASSSTANFVASDTDGTTNFWYNPSTNVLHAKYVNSDDSASVPTGITSNLNYVQGKDITLNDSFLSSALGSSTSDVNGAASSGTATVIVNHAVS